MRLRFWNSSQSSTFLMMDGCLDKPKTSAPRRNTRVATYRFAPLIKLTTAMTADTPMTTPTSVRTLRSLCAHRLDVEMATAYPAEGLLLALDVACSTSPRLALHPSRDRFLASLTGAARPSLSRGAELKAKDSDSSRHCLVVSE